MLLFVFLFSKRAIYRSALSTKKAAAVAKSHSSTLYFKYNERTTTYANSLPPPYFGVRKSKMLT